MKLNREGLAAKFMSDLTPIYWNMVEDYESGKELIKCQAETAVEMADVLLKQWQEGN